MLQPSPLSLIVNNQSETPVNDTTKDCRVIGEKGLIKCKELKTVNNLTAALSVSGSFDFPSEKKIFLYVRKNSRKGAFRLPLFTLYITVTSFHYKNIN